MMHPFLGHALIASGTPPGNRSANRMFDRFSTLTTPFWSVIWEFTMDVVLENFGMVLAVPPRVVTAA